MKICTSCRTVIQPNTMHQPARDELGDGICVVTHHAPGEVAYQSVPPRKPHIRLHYRDPPHGGPWHPWAATISDQLGAHFSGWVSSPKNAVLLVQILTRNVQRSR